MTDYTDGKQCKNEKLSVADLSVHLCNIAFNLQDCNRLLIFTAAANGHVTTLTVLHAAATDIVHHADAVHADCSYYM